MNTKPLLGSIFIGAAMILFGHVAHGATINWNTPTTTIGADTDVSATGFLIYAYNIGGTGITSATVNGVTFQPFQIPSFSNSTVTVDGNASIGLSTGDHFFSNTNGAGSANAPFSGLSAGYQNLLQSSITASGGFNTITLTLLQLVPGATYTIQLWSNDSGGVYNSVSSGSVTNYGNRDGNVNAIGVFNNHSGTNGGVGTALTGTFVADPNGQEAITINAGSGLEEINGFQLRSSTVPEPGAMALLAAGTGFLFCRRRRVA